MVISLLLSDGALAVPPDEALKRLMPHLPPTSVPLAPGKFGRFSKLIPGGGEHILIAPDADPILNSFLDRMKHRYGSRPHDASLLKSVSKEVRRVLGGGPSKFRPSRTARFEKMIRENVTFLGDFIENGMGVCRHQACLLQTSMEHLGVDSMFVVGEFDVIHPPSGERFDHVRHAWVQWSDWEKSLSYLSDPYQKRFLREFSFYADFESKKTYTELLGYIFPLDYVYIPMHHGRSVIHGKIFSLGLDNIGRHLP